MPISRDKIPLDVFIEISQGGRVKYEFDEELKVVRVDRILPTSMIFPAAYGFFINIKGNDGDPLDVLLFSSEKINSGTIINSRIIGVLKMEDEKGEDDKILVVPSEKVDKLSEHIRDYKSLGEATIEKIDHFFSTYKGLEQKFGKWVKIKGWDGIDEAYRIIEKSIDEYGLQSVLGSHISL